MQLAPSILAADFAALAADVRQAEAGGADLLHADVMDGMFVPNISFGAVVVKSLVGRTGLPLDVHLMIEDPDRYIEDFVTPQTAYITVHQEACPDLAATLRHIRAQGVLAGVAINPGTPVETLLDVLSLADLVLVMSVEPGFGGQRFMPETLDKVRALREIRTARDFSFVIEMDGGIKVGNLAAVRAAGTDIAVAGSAVFGAEDIAAAVRKMRAILSAAR